MTSPPVSHSGLVDIRGVTWRWYTVDPRVQSAAEMDEGAVILAFRTPVDPKRELRCVVRDPRSLPPTERQLRRLFEQAWAVEL